MMVLRSYPAIGGFLAYQYFIDLNYTPVLMFDEMEFVVPGPGAQDGIRKCFGTGRRRHRVGHHPLHGRPPGGALHPPGPAI